MRVILVAIMLSLNTFAASTYKLMQNTPISINEFGVCKSLTNNTAKTYFVPTGLAADWSTFLAHMPTDVVAGTCAPTNCLGNWGACSANCDGGTQTYVITTNASGGGSMCPYTNGATRSCNTQSCCWSSPGFYSCSCLIMQGDGSWSCDFSCSWSYIPSSSGCNTP